MHFPLEAYLAQLLFGRMSRGYPRIFSPKQYWRTCCIWHLYRCFENNWIEHCWHLDYVTYTQQYSLIVPRHYLEETDSTFLELCWRAEPLVYSSYCHPIELFC